MKAILFSLAILSPLFANAQIARDDREGLLMSVMNNKSAVEISIQKEISKSIGGTGVGSLKDFSVDWTTLDCVAAPISEFEPKLVGACVVSATAFQVDAQVSVTVTQNDTVVTVIYADVE